MHQIRDVKVTIGNSPNAERVINCTGDKKVEEEEMEPDEEQLRTLWVGGISDKVDEEVLFELFLNAGPLQRVIIPRDKDTKKARPYGFVVFHHPESVKYAFDLLNGTELCGQKIRLQNKATGLGINGAGGGGGFPQRGPQHGRSHTLPAAAAANSAWTPEHQQQQMMMMGAQSRFFNNGGGYFNGQPPHMMMMRGGGFMTGHYQQHPADMMMGANGHHYDDHRRERSYQHDSDRYRGDSSPSSSRRDFSRDPEVIFIDDSPREERSRSSHSSRHSGSGRWNNGSSSGSREPLPPGESYRSGGSSDYRSGSDYRDRSHDRRRDNRDYHISGRR